MTPSCVELRWLIWWGPIKAQLWLETYNVTGRRDYRQWLGLWESLPQNANSSWPFQGCYVTKVNVPKYCICLLWVCPLGQFQPDLFMWCSYGMLISTKIWHALLHVRQFLRKTQNLCRFRELGCLTFGTWLSHQPWRYEWFFIFFRARSASFLCVKCLEIVRCWPPSWSPFLTISYTYY